MPTAFQVQNTSGTTILGVNTATKTIFSTLASGSNAFTLTTESTYSSGNLLVLENNGVGEFAVSSSGQITTASVGPSALTTAAKQSFLQLGSGNTGETVQYLSEVVPYVGGAGLFTYALPTCFATSQDFDFITESYAPGNSIIWAAEPDGKCDVNVTYNTAVNGQTIYVMAVGH